MTMTRTDRWTRLQGILRTAGFAARLDTYNFTAGTYYRPVQKIGHSITFFADGTGTTTWEQPGPGRRMVHIKDTYTRADRWTGYSVAVEDREGIILAVGHANNRDRIVPVIETLLARTHGAG